MVEYIIVKEPVANGPVPDGRVVNEADAENAGADMTSGYGIVRNRPVASNPAASNPVENNSMAYMQEIVGAEMFDGDRAALMGSYIVTVLAKHGWLVVSAATVDDLNRQIDKHGPPRLIISVASCQTPEEAAIFNRLRKTAATSILAVVNMIDVYNKPWSANSLLAAADELIARPVAEDELVLRVRRLLSAQPASQLSPAFDRRVGAMNTPSRNMRLTAKSLEESMKPYDSKFSGAEAMRKLRLSKAERFIFSILEEAGSTAVAVEQLAEYMTVGDADKRVNAVRVHINRMRKKLNQCPDSAFRIVTVRGVGYVLERGVTPVENRLPA